MLLLLQLKKHYFVGDENNAGQAYDITGKIHVPLELDMKQYLTEYTDSKLKK